MASFTLLFHCSLLVLANWKEQFGLDCRSVLFEDLRAWLQICGSQDEVEDLRDQLCTGFLCIYLQEDVKDARKLLFQLRPLLPAEMFLSLGAQLKIDQKKEPNEANGFLARIAAIFAKILEAFKQKLSHIYGLLRKQPALFMAFCSKLVALIVHKLQ